MVFVNIVLSIALLVLVILEAKRTITLYMECKKANEELKKNKEVLECKAYNRTVSIYGSLIIIVFALGIVLLKSKEYLMAIMIMQLALLWINFIIESIYTKTILFYDSGFMYLGKQHKYSGVREIAEKSKFFRGYLVKVMGNDEIYITKDMKEILEERLKEYKNRKKK